MSMAEKSRPGPSSKSCPRLSPKHRKTLQGYGLNDSTIDAWGCYSVLEEDLRARGFAMGVRPPGIALPILPPGCRKAHGFMYKPDNPRQLEKKNGKVRICKYEHAVGALNHVHVPRSVQKKLFDEGHAYPRTLVITEGPIKAEKAAQEGIDCVALLGVWNWRQKFGSESVPIEDLDKIPWKEFDAVEVCFDSDAATNPNVLKAERALGAWLLKHGAANVVVVRLSPDEDGAKVGLDDYLRTHSAKDYKKLPRLPLDVEPPLKELVANLTPDIDKMERNRILGRIGDEEHDAAERERLLKVAASHTRISLGALKTSANVAAAIIQAKRREDQATQPLSTEQAIEAAKKHQEKTRAAVESVLNSAHDTITLRAQSISDSELGYVNAFGKAGSLFVCPSGVVPVADLPENFRITEPPPDASPMSGEGIRRFQNGEEVVSVELFEALRKFIQRRVIFIHECVPTMLALWLMGTYCYALFNYFGYVWLTSLGPSCGKSLLAEILSMVAFNATPPLVDPTPATVFRDIEANGSTFILDEVENLDPETKGELLSILNAGFGRGAKVRRMTPAGDGWTVRAFDVYGPKVIAGINQIPRPLQTRAFRIEMRKKKNIEHIEPFRPDRLTKWTTKRRDDLAIFALRNAKKIARLYARRDDLVPQRSKDGNTVFEDRLRDIFAPLYVMAAIVDGQAGEPVATPQLYKFLKLQAGARDSEGVGDYVLAAHVVWKWADERWNSDGKVLLKTADAKRLFEEAEIDWAAVDSAKAKSLLRKVGGINEVLWWKGKTERGYVFCRTELQDLVERNPISAKRTPGENRKDR